MSTDSVLIRGLLIEGIGTGLSGIKVNSGGAVHVENCTINNFTGNGIDFEPNAASGVSKLFVKNTIIRRQGNFGILIKPLGGVSASASIDATQLENNLSGLRAEDLSTVVFRDGIANLNTNNGFLAFSSSLKTLLTLENSVADGNGQFGVVAVGGGAAIQISNVTSTANGTGLSAQTAAQIISFGNNRVDGNGTNGSPTSTPGQI